MAGFNLFHEVPARNLKDALELESSPAEASATGENTAWPDLAAAVTTPSRNKNGSSQHGSENAELGRKQLAEDVKKGGPGKRAPTTSFSLADLTITRRQASNKAARPPEPKKEALSTRQLRKVRGFVKTYPTADKLAEAIRQKVQTSKPKSLSRLKRLILKERAGKAQQTAQHDVKQALERFHAAQTARDAMQTGLKEAEARAAEHNGDASILMQTQVLEMAVAEAERRCFVAQEALQEAEQKAAKAEADIEKLNAPRSTARPKILKSEMMSLRDTQKQEDEVLLPVKDSATGQNASSVEERPSSEAAGIATLIEDVSSDDDDLEGLENFEDTLASWMYEASKRNPQTRQSRPSSRNSVLSAPACVKQDEEAASSEAGSSVPSLDGWEDVLEAWMGQSEVKSAETSPHTLPTPDRARREFMGRSGVSIPRSWPSRPQSAGAGFEPSLSTPQRQVSLQSQTSIMSSLHTDSSPTTGMANGYPSDSRAQSSAVMVDLLSQISMAQASSQRPQPLLADILSGGQVSNDALLDLRARLPSHTMAVQSGTLDDGNGSYPSARTGGGGAAQPPSFPSRVSEIYAQLAQPNSTNSNLPSDPNELAILLKALEGNNFAQSPSPAAMPSLGNLDHLNLGSRLLTDAELLEVLKAIQSGTQPNFAANIDLFAHTDDFHVLADLGLPKLQGDPANVFGERLSYNVLTANQLKLLDNLAPAKPEWFTRTSQPPNSTQMSRPQQKPNTADGSPLKKQEQRPRDSNAMHGRQNLNGFSPPPGVQQGWWPPHQNSPGPYNGFIYPQQPYFSAPIAMSPGFQFGHPGNHPYFHQNMGTMNMPYMPPGGGMVSPAGSMEAPGMPRPPHPGMPSMPSMQYFQMRHSAPGASHTGFQEPQQIQFGSINSAPPASSTEVHHDRTCEICDIVCCGEGNFQQHLTSKRHLRRAAQAGAQAVNAQASQPDGENIPGNESTEVAHPTYMGVGAQCRNYCKQVITADLNKVVAEFLQQLLYWQERAKAMNPSKAKSKRLVSGLREVSKAVKFKKAKTIIVAPNIEQMESEGGLDDLLTNIMQQAEEADIPIIFALSRKKLGQVFGCRKKMSAIAILEYSGAEELYKRMGDYAEAGRKEWLANCERGDLSRAVTQGEEKQDEEEKKDKGAEGKQSPVLPEAS